MTAPRRRRPSLAAELARYAAGRAVGALALAAGYLVALAVVLAILAAGCDALGRVPPGAPGDYVPPTLSPIENGAAPSPSHPAPRPRATTSTRATPVPAAVYDCGDADPADPEIDPSYDCEDVTP